MKSVKRIDVTRKATKTAPETATAETPARRRRGSINKRKKVPWYVKFLLCGAARRKKMAKAMDADEAFWATFYRAYDALCTPVILGEIEKDTLDVRIVYANTAACDFTGYDAGEVSSFNPNGLIGRSVTDLMEDVLADAHAGFVSRWLSRRGIISAAETSQHSNNSSSEHSIGRDGMKEVEGISRRVAMVTVDGRSLTTDAALSFFTAKGLGKVIGIFSFKSAEELRVVSFKGLTFNLQYRPDKKSKAACYVVVEPPALLSDFSVDEKWRITSVTEGFVLKSGDLKTIKELIRKQVFHHLSKISCGSGLDITYVEKDQHAVSSSDMRRAHAALVDSINDSKTQENMHMSVEYRNERARGFNSLLSFDGNDSVYS